MGAQFYFDEKLRGERIRLEDGEREPIDRHVEVFTHDGKLYLRIGPPTDDTKGEPAVTVELPKNAFVSGVHDAGEYLGYLP